VVASEHREQAQNVEAALARMESLLHGAIVRPRPRKPTKPTRGSQRRRLAEKKRRAVVKRLRSELGE
jgi:ribosome-associated protein